MNPQRASKGAIDMKTFRMAVGLAAGMLLMAAPMFGQGEKDGQGQAVVTILPKHAGDAAANVSAQDVKLKVNGKDTSVTNLVPLRGPKDGLELVVLLDGSARSSLGSQLGEIEQFVQSLPPNAKVAIGYMENGRAALTGPLSSDHAQVLRGLHLPAGTPGSNGSPYFCLSDLAKRWPSTETGTRREVLMVTDGVDEYNRRYDPDDPYVQAAMNDSIRAGLVVYSIYWRSQGRADATAYANDTGQNLLVQVTQTTGGKSFWEGMGNPVSFQPYLEELTRRFQNQYELSFVTRFNGKPEIEGLKLKLSAPGSEVDAPQQVFVVRSGVAQN
jgi:hypothetical protein